MTTALPVVSVWSDEGGGVWAKRGDLGDYDSLSVQVRHLDVGQWSMTLPYTTQALAVRKDRLLTFDWRGQRLMTGVVSTNNPSSDEQTGADTLNVSGLDALSLLGRDEAWPAPTRALGSQPYPDPSTPINASNPAPGTYKAEAETLVLALIAENYRDRRGEAIVVPASQGRGSVVSARPRFDNLAELVLRKSRRGGIGVAVGLVDTSGTRARMTVQVYVPRDRSRRVVLSRLDGSIRAWSLTETAPTATKALVGGAGDGASRVWQVVTTPAATAAAAVWGGHRVVFVDGPDSFDPPELQQAGEEALDSGAATSNLQITAAESEGLLGFRDFTVGDLVTAQLPGGPLVDTITSMTATVGSTGVDVTPTFGDPDAHASSKAVAQILRGVRRDVRRLQTRR